MKNINRKPLSHPPFSMFSFQDIITAVIGILLMITLLMALELTLRHIKSPDAEILRTFLEMSQAIEELESDIDALRSLLAQANSSARLDLTHTEYSAKEETHAVETRITDLRDDIGRLDERLDSSKERLEEAELKLIEREADTERIAQLEEKAEEAQEELESLKSGNRVIYNAADARGRQVYLVELFPQDILVAPAGRKSAPIRFNDSTKEEAFLSWAKNHSTSRVRFMILVHPETTTGFNSIKRELDSSGYAIGFDLLPDDTRAIDEKFGAG